MATKHNTDGVINQADLYTVQTFKLRLGLTESAWRALRDRGLPVIRIGKRAYVSGRDAVAFLKACHVHQSEDHQAPTGQPGPTVGQP